MTKDEALKMAIEIIKNINWWEVIGWFLILYFGISEYGNTNSILKGIWNSLLLWSIMMIGYNWRNKS